MIPLDSLMLERFRTDGFLAFDSGLHPEDLGALRQTLTELHRRNGEFKEGALFDATGVDDGSAPLRFPQILHPRAFAPELID